MGRQSFKKQAMHEYTNMPVSSTHHVEVQSIDADARVILDAQVNVFLDTKAEVPGVGEVVFPQLVLTHLG